jgi:hypothetical protein
LRLPGRFKFLSNPQAHQKALQHLLCCFRGTTHLGIKYVTQDTFAKPLLRGYTGSDHGGSVVSERRRLYILLGYCPISWASNCQPTIATSSSEAEYIGQFNAGKEALWLKKFLNETGLQLQDDINGKTPVTIFGDNQAAITLSKDPVFPQLIKTYGYQIPLAARTDREKRSHLRIIARTSPISSQKPLPNDLNLAVTLSPPPNRLK